MMNKETTKKNMKEKEVHDFSKEYSEIFAILGIDTENIHHEWNKEGDTITEFNLYEDHPRPVLTPDTHSMDC